MSSPSTSPAKSRWSRVVRRASSVLVPSRPSTPSIASDREADSASLKGVPPMPPLLPPSKPVASHPSPIAESPARESSLQDQIPAIDPSPLAQAPVTASPEPEITETSPVQEYTPPPLIDSTAVGPGGYTDESDDLPQPQSTRDPSLFQADPNDGREAVTAEPLPQSSTTEPVTPDLGLANTGSNVDIPVHDEPADSNDGHGPITQSVDQTEAVTVESLPQSSTPEPVTPPAGLANTGSYFDIPVHDEPLSLEEDFELSNQPTKPETVADEDVFGPVTVMPVPALQEAAPEQAAREVLEEARTAPAVVAPELQLQSTRDLPSKMPTPAPQHAVLPVDHEEHQPAPEMPTPQMPTPAPQPAVLPSAVPAYPLPSFDYHSGQEVWGGVGPTIVEASKSTVNGDASTMSRSSSIRMPFQDPFADPIAPRIAVSQPMTMPDPHHQGHPESDSQTRAVIMPLPPVHQVIPSKSLPDFASSQSLLGNNGGPFETEYELLRIPQRHKINNHSNSETRPLLSRPGSPKNTSYLQPSSRNAVNVSAQSGMPASSAWPLQATSQGPRLHDLGWIEYQLPDGTVYYVHPTRRVTADIDLREDKKLDAVIAYFEHHKDSGGAPAGMELWLCENEANSGKRGFQPVRFWVNHKQRMVSLDQSSANGDAGRSRKAVEDDQLDIEYRYWSFMEAHPAHTALPLNARVEATDVLTWAWTDRLLPSHRSIPAPFTQEECQELMSLLRSFEQGENGLQTVVHTRIVSRILLRVAHWRQQHFRPNKPLPSDVGHHDAGLPKYRRPFRRALADFVISCFCLGIPYIFFERSRHYRIDEESGSRSPGPMFIVGACTCLIVSTLFMTCTAKPQLGAFPKAAIVLSASVTFLSLPGLDNFARLAGFVAILFATFSMASTLVALFRYKADLESPVSHVAGEGLLMLSRRSVVMSLPLVFLVYAIIGFATGIVLYSFRGVASDPLSSQRPFEVYTRWTVVGVLGGLAGMLTTSLLLLRR
ncbi:hypothetical protein D9615_010149 [Tricholomella constricta]|uniref:Uncharacterized protein n=1 Tax=Tricholomella constricta TaxID=117010 RepID=A0A8H5GR66_9AGAR|nr:hypothetical protein D9615_010149 [Tricholomella constricta]